MKRLIFRFGALLLVCAAAITQPSRAQEGGHRVITTTLTSNGAHKECVSLFESKKLRYWFRADAPFRFSIQFQSDKKVNLPVQRDGVSMGSGNFVATTAAVHCMVLTNATGRPVTVRLEFARLDD